MALNKNVFVIFLLALLLSSCGTKKKAINSNTKETKQTVELKKDSSSVNISKVDSTYTINKDSLSIKTASEVEVKKDETIDISVKKDTVTIEQEVKKDGTKKLTITGAKTISVGKKEKRSDKVVFELTQEINSYKTRLSKQDSVITKLNIELETQLEEFDEEKRKLVETQGTIIQWGIILIICIIVIFLILLFRKYITRKFNWLISF